MERRKFTREFKLEAVRLIKERGVSYAQASLDLGVHQSQLRGWVKALAGDPQQAFPGQGQMKPEQLEIARRLSGAHGGYLVDLKNYADRWLCLANLIDPQAGSTCYNSYPEEWFTLPD